MTGRGVRAADFLPAFLTDGGFYLIVFALTHILDAAGAGSGEVALVFGTYTLSYAAITPLLGRASDAKGRRRSVLAGSLVFVVVSLALSAVIVLEPEEAGLRVTSRLAPFGVEASAYTGIALLAVANALFWPAFQARIGDRERDAAGLGRAIRSFNVGWTAGKALGFLGAGLLFQLEPRACLPVGALCGGLVFLSVLAEPWLIGAASGAGHGADPAPSAGPRTPLPQHVKRAFLLAGLLTNFVLWGALSTLKSLAPKLADVLQIGVAETGVLLFVALAAQGLGFFALSGERGTYRANPLVLAVPGALVGLLLFHFARGLPLALCGAVLIGLAQAVTYTASVYYSLDYDERRGLRTGIHEAVLAVGGALPILGGLLADATGDLRAPLLFMAGLCALSLPFIVWLLRAGRRGETLYNEDGPE